MPAIDDLPPVRTFTLTGQEWLDEAVCGDEDPELFFPPEPNPGRPSASYLERAGAQIEFAKAVCATCPVQEKCLAWALDNDEVGIWGGTTDQERSEMNLPLIRACPECRRPTRSKRMSATAHPGTVTRAARGLCAGCYRRAIRADHKEAAL